MPDKKYRVVIEFTASNADEAREIALCTTVTGPAKDQILVTRDVSVIELQEEFSYFSAIPLLQEAKA